MFESEDVHKRMKHKCSTQSQKKVFANLLSHGIHLHNNQTMQNGSLSYSRLTNPVCAHIPTTRVILDLQCRTGDWVILGFTNHVCMCNLSYDTEKQLAQSEYNSILTILGQREKNCTHLYIYTCIVCMWANFDLQEEEE